MKKFGLFALAGLAGALVAVAAFSLLTGDDGDSASASAADASTTTTTEEVATESDVTADFQQWRAKRASKVGTNAIGVSVEDVSCQIKDNGKGTCSETVSYDSKFASLDKTETYAWEIEYDTESGDVFFAKVID